MPIHSSWSSLIKSLNSQYCKNSSRGASPPFKCKKAQSVFYALLNKKGWDDKKPAPKGDHSEEEWIKEAMDLLGSLDESIIEKMYTNLAVLTTKQRNKLPDSAFCDPANRRYPASDPAHIRNGLARIRQNTGDPKYKSILRCLIGRANKAGIKVSEDVKKGSDNDEKPTVDWTIYPDKDFALILPCGQKMFQFAYDGITSVELLADSLKTIDYTDELSDEDWYLTKRVLLERADEYLKEKKVNLK